MFQRPTMQALRAWRCGMLWGPGASLPAGILSGVLVGVALVAGLAYVALSL